MFNWRGKGIVPACLAVVLLSGQAFAEPEFVYSDVTRALSYELTTPAVPGPGTVILDKKILNDDGETEFEDLIGLEYFNTKITANGVVSHVSTVDSGVIDYAGETVLELSSAGEATPITVSTTSALSIEFAVSEEALLTLGANGEWNTDFDGIDGAVAGSTLTLSAGDEVLFESDDANYEFTAELKPGTVYTLESTTNSVMEDTEANASGVALASSYYTMELDEVSGDPPSDCPADLNGDGVIDGLDLNIVLGNFGKQSDEGDVDGDGDVDSDDLVKVLGQHGTSCEGAVSDSRSQSRSRR